jgi:hypothetical protein
MLPSPPPSSPPHLPPLPFNPSSSTVQPHLSPAIERVVRESFKELTSLGGNRKQLEFLYDLYMVWRGSPVERSQYGPYNQSHTREVPATLGGRLVKSTG